MRTPRSLSGLLVLAALGCSGGMTPEVPSAASRGATTAPTTSGSTSPTTSTTTTPPPPTTAGSTHMQVSDIGDPTGPEQELVELANRARRDPIAEGNRYGLNFAGMPAVPPLAPNALLAKASLSHTTDMAVNHYYDHQNPKPGSPDPQQQVKASGYDENGTGQNIDCGPNTRDAKEEHKRFIVDAGVSPPGHRWNILSYSPPGTPPIILREAGMSFITDQVAKVGADWDIYVTQNFSSTKHDRPFVTGVVFTDANASGEYDAGEGVAGVKVKVTASDGTFVVATTKTAGGFAVEVNDNGTYVVEMSGGPFATPVSLSVNVVDDNVKVDGVAGKGIVKR